MKKSDPSSEIENEELDNILENILDKCGFC